MHSFFKWTILFSRSNYLKENFEWQQHFLENHSGKVMEDLMAVVSTKVKRNFIRFIFDLGGENIESIFLKRKKETFWEIPKGNWVDKHFLCGDKFQTLQSNLSPLILINNIFKGQAHLVYYITLNLNISASRQYIKNLMGTFGAVHVGIMHAKFQASSFSCVGREWGDWCTHDVTPDPWFLYSLRFGRVNFHTQMNSLFKKFSL